MRVALPGRQRLIEDDHAVRTGERGTVVAMENPVLVDWIGRVHRRTTWTAAGVSAGIGMAYFQAARLASNTIRTHRSTRATSPRPARNS
ncbi:hypothetical protein [Saccharopolyspora spinosa]|uniref:hypothetical protein n=1 Tax=Saccharopolyspora spinosa TaxID=60894 RepID=UPI000237A9EF|nr:hypothetical protein [Saccharopolyspora spinosa]